jgi:hypothetical protein
MSRVLKRTKIVIRSISGFCYSRTSSSLDGFRGAAIENRWLRLLTLGRGILRGLRHLVSCVLSAENRVPGPNVDFQLLLGVGVAGFSLKSDTPSLREYRSSAASSETPTDIFKRLTS